MALNSFSIFYYFDFSVWFITGISPVIASGKSCIAAISMAFKTSIF